MAACGKTYYLFTMLEEEYKGVFEIIFLICPTFIWNKTYHNWRYLDDKNFFVLPCEQDDREIYLRYVVNYAKETNSLIILDDCASGQSVKNRVGELVKLGFGARHMGISTIVITQQLTSIANHTERIFRSWLLFTIQNNRQNMSTILNEYPFIDENELRSNKEKLKETKTLVWR